MTLFILILILNIYIYIYIIKIKNIETDARMCVSLVYIKYIKNIILKFYDVKN